MAYDEELADRIARELRGVPDITSRAMFGGFSWLLHGNLACGVIGDELCVRVGPDAFDNALLEPDTRVFDFSGRPMKGWVMVAGEGLREDSALATWVGRGLDFAASLPAKG